MNLATRPVFPARQAFLSADVCPLDRPPTIVLVQNIQSTAPHNAGQSAGHALLSASSELPPATQLHLIAEPALVRASVNGQPPPTPRLAIAKDTPFLLVPMNAAPRLVAHPPESFADVLILESLVNSAGQLRLVVLNPAAGTFLVNGRPAPRVALLREKDEFSLNSGPSLFVTIWRHPRIGPPDVVTLGKPCPVCRVPLTTDTRVYHCPCGCGLHCERPEDKAEPLQCGSLSDSCVRCNSTIVREPGFSWLPDFSHA